MVVACWRGGSEGVEGDGAGDAQDVVRRATEGREEGSVPVSREEGGSVTFIVEAFSTNHTFGTSPFVGT